MFHANNNWFFIFIFRLFFFSILFRFIYIFRCGCDECVISRMEDSLRHSRSRINAYRALASPSLIALSSKDPILTAFELSWELRRLSFLEHEFKVSHLNWFLYLWRYRLHTKHTCGSFFDKMFSLFTRFSRKKIFLSIHKVPYMLEV